MKKTCDICQKSATVHVSFVHGQKLSHAAYCMEHAEMAGVLDPLSYGLIDDGEVHDFQPVSVGNGAVCSHCGLSLREWKQTGRLGCAHCYTTFHDEIESVLPRMHRGLKHMGRAPRMKVNPVAVNNRIQKLQGELEQAVKDERYEDAAVARDEMSLLRSQLEDLK